MVVKTVFFVSRGQLRRNNFLFHKNFKTFSCFQTLRKTFRIFGEKNLVGLSKLLSSVQGTFSEEFVFENKFLEMFLYFWSSGANFLDFRRKICDRFVKTSFYVSSGDFWLDCLFYEKFWVFDRLRAVRKIFWHFGAKPSKSLSKLQFMCKKIFCGKFEFWKKTFTFFSRTDQKFCDFWQKCWVIEKLWVRLFFSSDKIHVFLRKLKEKLFCGR